MKTLPAILLTLAIAIPATWISTQQLHNGGASSAATSGQPAGRKLLYYQSAMHPWIKSPKPGRCTICGMELTPVYEGDAGFDAAGGGDVVPLTQTMIQVVNVQTAEAQVRPLTKTLTVAGMIDDNATRHRVLSAYIPGRVQKLYVNFMGAEVKEGQPLAEFYSPTLLQSEREYRTLTGELRSATALRLLQMGLTSAQIEALPEKPGDNLTSQILSPIGGTVVAQNVYEGQYVQEGERLFEIADFSTMWFQFRAYEQDLPWIKPGLKVDITTPSHPGKTFTGSITFIDPNFDEATRSTKVRVELENPIVEGRRLLLHRLYADGLVRLDLPDALTIPRTAVIETGPEAVAYVDQGGGAYSRRVLQLGRRGDALVEVASGLSVGDKVVVNGNLLIDGQAEMNRAFAEPATTNAPATALPALTDAQRKAVKDFLTLADAITAALAADKLDDFNTQAAKSHAAMPALMDAFVNSDKAWHPLLKSIEEAGHLEKADDLKAARKTFHPFSNAAVALAQALRRSGKEFASLKVFRCPMTKNAFEGAPKTAEWMQLQPSIRNPYFGAEMLDCGAEVKP
ncbi:MAG: efflux RND transporter periplasmic adaptor subunit [Verrucomicrobia bacterium]|nr:efflux RND transporter periplasmic adaptor subunit [Verrucomicrobiota bacterium]